MQWESSRVHALVDQPVHAHLGPLPLAVYCPGQNLVNLKGREKNVSPPSAYRVRQQAGESLAAYNPVPLRVGEITVVVVAAEEPVQEKEKRVKIVIVKPRAASKKA